MSKVVAFALVAVATATAFAADLQSEGSVTLSGCLVRGTEDIGYLLTNVGQPMLASGLETAIQPGPLGTAGSSPVVFYWVIPDERLAQEPGHLVLVDGEREGPDAPGEMKITRAANWTDLAVESGATTLRARLSESMFALSPPAPLVVDPATGITTVKVMVRHVKVIRIRSLSQTCE